MVDGRSGGQTLWKKNFCLQGTVILKFRTFLQLFSSPGQPPDLSLISNLLLLSKGLSKQMFFFGSVNLGILVQVHLVSHN